MRNTRHLDTAEYEKQKKFYELIAYIKIKELTEKIRSKHFFLYICYCNFIRLKKKKKNMKFE